MESGLLKDKITFQKMTVTVDVYGHEITTYTDAFTTRADVIWNNGNRIVSNDEILFFLWLSNIPPSVQLSRVRLFATPSTAAHQASLSITNS